MPTCGNCGNLSVQCECEKVECKECKGVGKLYAPEYEEMRYCKNCDGTGEVMKSTEWSD